MHPQCEIGFHLWSFGGHGTKCDRCGVAADRGISADIAANPDRSFWSCGKVTYRCTAMAAHDPDFCTDSCRRCGARLEEIEDNLVPVCDPAAVKGLRQAQAQAVLDTSLAIDADIASRKAWHDAHAAAVAWVSLPDPAQPTPDPHERPMSKAIIDEWTRRR